jgi:hypothetical protein
MVEIRHPLTTLTLCLLFAGSARSEPSAVDDRQLARLGTVVLCESDFKHFATSAFSAEQIAGFWNQPEARQAAITAWLDLRVQAAKARKDGIDQRETFQKALELMEMKLLVRAMMDRNRPHLATPGNISAAEIEQYYQQHPKRFQRPSQSGGIGREPLQDVRARIANHLARERNSGFHRAFLAQLRNQLDFRQTEHARPEASLLDSDAVAKQTTIAFIGGIPVTEDEFRWFLKDAYRAEQRQQAFSPPGARRIMLDDFLTMRLMAAEARKLKLHQDAPYRDALEVAELRLLTEFLLERDNMTPWKLPGKTQQERVGNFRKYLDELAIELEFTR